MKSTNQETLLEFPCDFALKVMGKANTDFDLLVVEIVRKHCPDLGEGAVRQRESKGGNYVSVTVNIVARSKSQLDALYTELSTHERTLMVL
jgi:putative lipoic acid-binding regulatory protein